MKVTILKDGEQKVTEVECANLQSCLSILKLQYGKEFTDSIISNNYKFIVLNSAEPEKAVQIIPEMAIGNFKDYDSLMILEDIGGEIPLPVVVFALGAMGASLGTAATMAVTALVNVALSFALNAVMGLLSPTQQFSSDPSGAQKSSNLFNGGVVTTEQGGIVPYLIGNCFTGGTVISAGISTEEG